MRAVERTATVPASTVNVPVSCPPGIVIDATVGAATPGAVDDRFTTMPAAAAGVSSVMVPVDVCVERTVVGDNATVCTELGRTRRLRDAVLELNVARIATLVDVAVADVVTAKGAETVFPACTVTVAGTCASEVFDVDSVSTTPPAGAGLEIVTVPVTLRPPLTATALRLTAVNVVP
jgi:hypothetical protein